MAIAFPRDFPLDGKFTGACPFDLVYQQARAMTGGAQPTVVDLGPAMWVGSWSTTALSRAEFGEWAAWLSSLRGGLRTFKGRPALWKWPRSRPTGFAGLVVGVSQWDGTGNLSAIGVNRDTVTVNQMPNGLVIGLGDYLSFAVGARQHLHRVVEGATVAGNQIVLGVEPAVRPNAVTAVEVQFAAPYCDMVLSDRRPRIERTGTRGGSIAFEGVQVLI